MNRRKLLRFGSLAALGSLAGCGTGRSDRTAEETFSDRYPAEGGLRVNVLGRNGSITATKVSGMDVVVEAVKRSRDGRSALERVDVEVTRTGGVLTARAVYPDVSPLSQPRVAVDFEVGIPAAAVAGVFESANGDVVVRDVAGDARLASVNGRVEADNVDGFVSLRSGNGDVVATWTAGVDRAVSTNGAVDVDLRHTRGPVTAASTNGDVTVRPTAGLRATFELRTVTGAIVVSGLTLERTTDAARHVVGRYNGGGDRVTARTTNGDVRLRPLE
ncbi:MAG: DUF4097 family beta strand repeat-containing protein [Halobacteriales archaeon]